MCRSLIPLVLALGSVCSAQSVVEEDAILWPRFPQQSAGFGVSLSARAGTMVVGKQYGGSASVYKLTSQGWEPEAELTIGSGTPYFGYSVATDGERILVGDYEYNAEGRAHVFARGGGGWVLEATLTGSDISIHDDYGFSLAIDGEVAVVGAPEHIHGTWGGAFVYRRSGSSWMQEAELDPTSTAVAIHGSTIVCGAGEWGFDPGAGLRLRARWVRLGARGRVVRLRWDRRRLLREGPGAPG